MTGSSGHDEARERDVSVRRDYVAGRDLHGPFRFAIGGESKAFYTEAEARSRSLERENAINDVVEALVEAWSKAIYRLAETAGRTEADERVEVNPSRSSTFTAPSTVTIGREGRITLPAILRSLLGLEEGAQLVVDVDQEHQWIRLRPAVTVPREQAWAYTPEHLARVARALADVAENRVAPLSEEELLERIGKVGQEGDAQAKID